MMRADEEELEGVVALRDLVANRPHALSETRGHYEDGAAPDGEPWVEVRPAGEGEMA